ncbi:tRNA lysidine(34) synthetase TilS [Georgenia sp. EYE_87]|uniref:tRNA lysidine(34) synthetase TilS n=1 Tax=Georgenia sp. EYE_87 TaxID=2853448 RepID=UPI002005F76A|nr:tRNA lysidine(34) synthetase TilS [Georgenia sp. EYE_87]MCK6209745.1 tRNA lysidine(34) synthetase TilS [Georgenia sp. EYE_87]
MAGPPPDLAAARRAVRAALADLPPGARVLVACSGGADSLALAAATAFVAPREGWLAGAVVVDHRLQPGSGEVAGTAAGQCRALGLEPVTVREVEVDGGARGAGAGGPEAAARTARYAALTEVARETGAAAVLLGHTLDDQAETVLLALARGSGARSLAGMPAARGLWRRPLLGLRRAQTEQVCRAVGLQFVRDPANTVAGPWRAADGTPLRRAAVRERVLPALTEALGPGVVEALGRTARQLARDADLLDDLAEELLARAIAAAAAPAAPAVPAAPAASAAPAVGGAGGRDLAHADGAGLGLDVAVLADAHPALRTRALHTAALRAGATPGALAAVHVDALDALVTRYHGQGPVPLPGPVVARRRCGRLTLAPAGPAGRPAT